MGCDAEPNQETDRRKCNNERGAALKYLVPILQKATSCGEIEFGRTEGAGTPAMLVNFCDSDYHHKRDDCL